MKNQEKNNLKLILLLIKNKKGNKTKIIIKININLINNLNNKKQIMNLIKKNKMMKMHIKINKD